MRRLIVSLVVFATACGPVQARPATSPLAAATTTPIATSTASPASSPQATSTPSPTAVDVEVTRPLERAGMAYDGARGNLVLFGTVYSAAAFPASGAPPPPGSATPQTWTWQSGKWSNLNPTASPPPRTNAGMVYDEGRHQVVLFGGQDAVESVAGQGLPPLSDTWTWDGTTWAKRTPATSPPAATGASLVYDSKLGRVVALVNPFQNGSQSNETWTWDGDTWAQIHPTVDIPGPRYHSAVAYDPAHDRVVVFGRRAGVGMDLTEDADTWTFDGKTWERHAAAAGGPPGRLGAAMVFDPSSGKVIMFGGDRYSGAGAGLRTDTWTWDGSGWTEAHPADSPWARTNAAAASDVAAGRVILYGGSANTQYFALAYTDVWTWANGSWTLIQPTTVPASVQRETILKVASIGPGLLASCSAASAPCMSLHGEPQLGHYAAYAVFDLNPPQGTNAQCVSYLSALTRDSYVVGPWHQVGVTCGPFNGHMPQLGAQVQVGVSGCANVRTFPEGGSVISCVPNGTLATIDDGPVAIFAATPTQLWWHLQHRGWIAHELLSS
jgi:hypothetical protein